MGKILCKIFIDNLGIMGYNGYNKKSGSWSGSVENKH